MAIFVGKPNFRDQFKKFIKRHKRVEYNMDIMRQSAYLVVNPITVDMVSSWLNLRFSLALTIRESWALFIVSSLCVIVNWLYLRDDTLH